MILYEIEIIVKIINFLNSYQKYALKHYNNNNGRST